MKWLIKIDPLGKWGRRHREHTFAGIVSLGEKGKRRNTHVALDFTKKVKA